TLQRRHDAFVMCELIGEMLVDRPNMAQSGGGGALQLWSAVDEPREGALERDFASGAIQDADVGCQLIACRSAVRNNQWNAAGARFCRNQTGGLRFAAMDQSVGAREDPRQFSPVR